MDDAKGDAELLINEAWIKLFIRPFYQSLINLLMRFFIEIIND